MARPFVLVAPTGSRNSGADHPNLPVTIPEIARTAAACRRAGADGLHLHVRDALGTHSLDPGLYREALSELDRTEPGLPVQVTTEAAGLFDVAAQLGCLKALRPQWASVAVREIARAPDLAPQVYGLCADAGTRVQHIVYDRDDVALLRRWQARGVVAHGQTDMLFVLGSYDPPRVGTPGDLDRFAPTRRGAGDWMICAFGPGEHCCLRAAARMGGDLRVGFENSRQSPDGTPWPDNAASVAALVAALDDDAADAGPLRPRSQTDGDR